MHIRVADKKKPGTRTFFRGETVFGFFFLGPPGRKSHFNFDIVHILLPKMRNRVPGVCFRRNHLRFFCCALWRKCKFRLLPGRYFAAKKTAGNLACFLAAKPLLGVFAPPGRKSNSNFDLVHVSPLKKTTGFWVFSSAKPSVFLSAL